MKDNEIIPIVPTSPKRGKSYLTSTYYRLDHANRMKEILDKILADPQRRGIVIPYHSSGYQNKTLETFIRHSWAYLNDYMDDDGKYRKLYNQIKISAEDLGIGIRFRTLDNIANTIQFVSELAKPDDVVPRSEENVPWKRELLAFMESAQEGQPFERTLKTAKFTDGDETWLLGVLGGDSWKYVITKDRMSLIVLKLESEP